MISSVIVVIFFIFSNVLGLDLENLEYEQTYHSGNYSTNFFIEYLTQNVIFHIKSYVTKHEF